VTASAVSTPGGDEALVVDVIGCAAERAAHRVIRRDRLGQDEREGVQVGRFRCGAELGRRRVPALAKIHRVLRPDGELRFFEHVGSPRRARSARFSEPPTPPSGRAYPAAATLRARRIG
jgi:hypothetical protein